MRAVSSRRSSRTCGPGPSSCRTTPTIPRPCRTGPSGQAVTTCFSRRAPSTTGGRATGSGRPGETRLGQAMARAPEVRRAARWSPGAYMGTGPARCPAHCPGRRPGLVQRRRGRPARPRRRPAGLTSAPPPAPHPWRPGFAVIPSSIPRIAIDGKAGTYPSGKPGLPTYGTPHSDFPKATAGVVLPAGKHSYASYQLAPHTVYYLLPGIHIGSFQASKNDAFVGGRSHGKSSVISGEYSGYPWAIDSNYSNGNQPGVTIEYLTIEKFQPRGDAAAVNQSSNTDWTLRYNTIRLNVPGAGVIAGADNTLKGQLPDPERAVRFPILGGRPLGPRHADQRPLQHHDRRQRDQLQRHLRLRGTVQQ